MPVDYLLGCPHQRKFAFVAHLPVCEGFVKHLDIRDEFLWEVVRYWDLPI